MVRFTLDKAMFDRGRIKVPELQELSGINKNTLYAIYNNSSSRVDLSVINRLCKALNCTPADIFEYVPDIE